MHMLKSMRASFAIFLWCVVEKSFGVAQVSLSGASPCFQGASCDLTCTAVGGTVKTGGFIFSRNGVDVVVCQDKTTCNSYVPAAYGLTIGNDTYSGLSIANFNETTRGGQWCCYDRPTGSPSCKQVITNVVPSGTIDLPSSCTGTAPHTVSCSFANLGTPNASLILSNSSGTLISQTTSPVSYSLTSSGNVTCSVQWPAFPNYVLNIPSVTTECIITTPPPATPSPGTSPYTSTVPSPSSLPSSTWSVSETSTPSISTENGSSLATTTFQTVTKDDVNKNSKLVGSIVGGIVAGFVVIASLCLIIFFCARRRKRGSQRKATQGVSLQQM